MARRYLFSLLVALCALLAGWKVLSLSVRTDESAHAPPPPVISDADREFLWICENRGNLLGRHGWSQLATTIRSANADAAAALLTRDFTGSLAESASGWDAHGAVSFRTSGAGEGSASRLPPVEFAQRLVALRKEFGDTPPRVQFGLLAIGPARRDEIDGLWTGKSKLRLAGRDPEGRPLEVTTSFEFDCLSPTESVLHAGNWLARCDVDRVRLARSPDVLMPEVAAERGLDTATLYDNWTRPTGEWFVTTGGVYLCDFNRDAFTDVLVTEPFAAPHVRLYRGSTGGHFQDVTADVGLPQRSEARHVAIADLDGDGWEDLVFPDFGVFKNLNGTGFRDMTAATNLIQLMARVGLDGITGLTVADYDLDGRVDIYLTRGDSVGFKRGTWIDASSQTPGGNRLYRNLGGGYFEDVTYESGTACQDRSVFTAAWLHADRDIWPDIYVIHEFGPGALLINQRDGTFQTREIASASSDFGSMGLASGDIDNDGLVDLFVSNMYSKAGNRVMNNLPPGFYDDEIMSRLRRMVAGSQIHRNLGGLEFEQIGPDAGVATVGWGWGATLVDLDNDGWLDVHETCGFMSRDRTKPDG